MTRKELNILIEQKVRKILKEFRITPEMDYITVCRDLFYIDKKTFDSMNNKNNISYEKYYRYFKELIDGIKKYHYQYIIRSMAIWIENEFNQILRDLHGDHIIDIVQLMSEFKSKILKLYK